MKGMGPIVFVLIAVFGISALGKLITFGSEHPLGVWIILFIIAGVLGGIGSLTRKK